MYSIGHTVVRCKAPPAEDTESGGWNNGAAAGGGASGGWDSVGGVEATAASGDWAGGNTAPQGTTSWADDTEGAQWGNAGTGGW